MAQRLILAGEVRVDGEIASRASQPVSPETRIEVLRPPPYVSRGGEKLQAALDAFGLDVSGKV
ncbi:MAG TPA: S4 domain-containing protein, partial [Anaerolineales bacterium]|nr:S4 domain-containing protein [Anaerolineales bacterium]